MDLPTSVVLTRCATGAKELGTIETLHREDAKNKIDAIWWVSSHGLIRRLEDEPDRHWQWRAIISRHQSKPSFQAKCVRTQDSQIQAAMLFRVDAMSALEQGQHAVFLDRLATAPRNRDGLFDAPVFRGAGTGLLTYAVALSYSLGFSGRVNLFPVANEEFYTSKGFRVTTVVAGEETLFEIPTNDAMRLLTERGLFDG